MKRAFVVGLLLGGTLAFAQSRETRMGVNGSSGGGQTLASVADGGVVVSGSTVYCAPASATGTGCIDTGAQTIAGLKTFSTYLTTSSERLYLNEGAAAANVYISVTGSAVSRYLQWNNANTWNFTGGVPTVQVNSVALSGSPSSVNMQYIQRAASAATAGVLSVTFGTAYSAAPICTCSSEFNVACYVSTAPSTTAVAFTATGSGTAKIHWICIGNR